MLFLLLGLIIAVSTVVILTNISQVMNADIATKLDEYGANILIVPRSNDLSLSYGGMSVAGVSFDAGQLVESDAERIMTIKNKKNIKIVAPKLLNLGTIPGGEALVVGVDFAQEIALKKWWSIIGEAPAQENEALIGSEVKRKLSAGLNQEIFIEGQPFKVTGILEETGSQDDGLVFIDIKQAQEIFNKPSAISLIEVAALCYDCPIEEIVAQTSAKLPNAKVTAIRQTIDSKMQTVQHLESFSFGLSIVIILIGALIVFTTMTASVSERTREIGIFRAIGYRKGHIMHIILLEAAVISALAGLLGHSLGILIAKTTAPLIGVDSVSVGWNGSIFLLALLGSIALGMISSFYPAYRASRLDPSSALRAL
jgi:putative ABC transport system permease protein